MSRSHDRSASHELYRDVSKRIRAIFRRYTDVIEPLSLDEAYLDVTDCEQCHGSATLIAEDIRSAIRTELQLTASAGIAPVKFLAKICSDENKPDGQFVITPSEVDQFTASLPLSCLLYTSPSPRDQRGTRMPSSA